MSMDYIFLIVLLVAMILMMVFQTRKAKKQQAERQSFWKNLDAGTEVITIGGVIGKVVEVDEEYDEIVIDSEGSGLRLRRRRGRERQPARQGRRERRRQSQGNHDAGERALDGCRRR